MASKTMALAMAAHKATGPAKAAQPGHVMSALKRHKIDGLQVYAVAVALIFNLLVLSALAFVYDSNTRTQMQARQTQQKFLLQMMDQHLHAAFQLVDHTLEQGRTQWLESKTLKDHREISKSFPNFKNLIFQIAVIDADGMLNASSIDAAVKPISLADRPHFMAHLGAAGDQLYVGQPLIGRVSKKLSVQVSRPIFRRDGKFAGVIVASVDTNFLDNLFNPEDWSGLSFGAVGEDGIKRLWHGPMELLPPASGETYKFASLTGFQFDTAKTPWQPAGAWQVQPLDGYPLRVVVGVDMSAQNQANHTQQLIMVGIALLLAMASIVRVIYMLKAMRKKNQLLLALRQTQTKANSANAMKSRFLADISHDLRTPLNGILGFSELVCRSTDLAKTISFGKLIHTSAQQLHALINTMMDLAKIEAGKMDLHLTTCSLSDICEAVKTIERPSAASKDLLLSIDYEQGLPETIDTDRIKLMQILSNVLHNAVKFTAQGGVFLNVARQQKEWVFTIADSGIGMTPAQLVILFDRYSTAHEDEHGTDAGQGSRLGMAVCKELVELMGGHISATSTPGTGTVVEVRLPMNPKAA